MQEMRLIVQDYLTQLKERSELDAILADLLRSMGFQIIKLAFRGEVEHGVDIAAIKTDEGETKLYLFQVKEGDIDQQMWDGNPNSVRPSLSNLLDVPFKDLTQPHIRQAKRKAVLVHNGTVRQNIRERFNGFIERDFLPRMEFEVWNVDILAKYFSEHLLNERILPKQYHVFFKRIPIFIDVPDYDLIDLKQLLSKILPTVGPLTNDKIVRTFSFVRLILAMVYSQSTSNSNNLSPVLAAYEYALLTLWAWMWKNRYWRAKVKEEFNRTYLQYLNVLTEWVDKITPAIQAPDGLAFNGTFELVEYPLRTFQVIGNVSLLAAAHTYTTNIADDEEKIQKSANLLKRYAELLIQTIHNNPSRHRPLLDNHAIDIFLGLWVLLLSGKHNVAYWWLNDLLEHLAIRKKVLGRLPELYNNIDAVIEYEATSERPIEYVDSSSTLIYVLFEFFLLFNDEALYTRYRTLFNDVNFQVWYPPENVEEILYSREVREGDTETIHSLPEKFEDFRLDVEARHRHNDREEFSPLEHGFPAILLLASKHFRTPIFPFWWRDLIFPPVPEHDGGNQKIH